MQLYRITIQADVYADPNWDNIKNQLVIGYQTEDGNIGFKHTSNKKGWNAPHNNTSVRVKGARIQKISDKVAQQNNLSPEQTENMKTTLSDTIEEGAQIVDKAENVVDEHIKDVDEDEFVDNLEFKWGERTGKVWWIGVERTIDSEDFQAFRKRKLP